MIVQHSLDAQTIGVQYAREIASEAGVRGIWAASHRDWFDVWVLTDAVDDATERRLFEASLALHDSFPESLIRLHVVNPRFRSEGADLMSEIPTGAPYINVHH